MKSIEKKEHLSEDITIRAIEEIQKITDSYMKKVEETIALKEEEVMEV